MELTFQSRIIEWRGPSPFFFAAIPEAHVADIRRAAKLLSYGWGVIPVSARIGSARFTTSLFPRDGGYLLPIKAAVRRQCNLTAGDAVTVAMGLGQKA